MNKLEGVDLIEYLELVAKQESQSIHQLSDAVDGIWERMQNGPQTFGDPMPWEKTHNIFRFRPSEVTLWGGVNGHGKSLVLSQVSIALMQRSPICVASLEMTMPALGERLVRQAAGGLCDVTEMGRILAATDDRYFVYDECDSVDRERILGMAIYAMKELRCGHVIVDSLVKCGIATDDYKGQKEFVDRLCWVAKTYGGHIHLVHHLRKGSSENDLPDKVDVKGAGEITDLVDNLVLVWRNKGKEQAIQEGDNYCDEDPDCALLVRKQRHGEWEGKIKLWFDSNSHQFKGSGFQPIEKLL